MAQGFWNDVLRGAQQTQDSFRQADRDRHDAEEYEFRMESLRRARKEEEDFLKKRKCADLAILKYGQDGSDAVQYVFSSSLFDTLSAANVCGDIDEAIKRIKSNREFERKQKQDTFEIYRSFMDSHPEYKGNDFLIDLLKEKLDIVLDDAYTGRASPLLKTDLAGRLAVAHTLVQLEVSKNKSKSKKPSK